MDESTVEILSLLETLDGDIDKLEEALEPLLSTDLTDITNKLPLLDRARLNVLVAYAIESMIFSALKIQGVDAKEHPVFAELARVRQYFQKIEDARSDGPAKRPNMTLDKQAAARFIKHGLSGNDKFDAEREQRIIREKAIASNKLKILDTKETDGATSNKRKRKASTDAAQAAQEDQSGSDANNPQTDSPMKEAEATSKEATSKAERKAAKEAKRARKEARRNKSNTAPRSASQVFADLANRPSKKT